VAKGPPAPRLLDYSLALPGAQAEPSPPYISTLRREYRYFENGEGIRERTPSSAALAQKFHFLTKYGFLNFFFRAHPVQVDFAPKHSRAILK